MVKPSLTCVLVGVVMLKPGWMNRCLPPIGRAVAADVAVIFGFVSAGLRFTSAMLNVVVAVNFNVAVWFMSVYGIASKADLFLIGYARMHYIGVRRWRATSTLDCDRPTASLRLIRGRAPEMDCRPLDRP
jgi:intracellular septation protein